MTIPSQFPEWLKVADRDGRGGLSSEFPSINRGRTRSVTLSLSTHPDFGDWTAGTFSAVLRAGPDAGGSPLASYVCTTGAPAGGVTPVNMVLDGANQSGLPAGGDDGLAEVFLEVVFTPTSGDPLTILSTRQLISGVI